MKNLIFVFFIPAFILFSSSAENSTVVENEINSLELVNFESAEFLAFNCTGFCEYWTTTGGVSIASSVDCGATAAIACATAKAQSRSNFLSIKRTWARIRLNELCH